jgi:hypothetical protein
MSAREDIAYLLWQIVPSEDDSKAKGNAERMLDAHRAEVRREDAARLLDHRRPHISRAIFCDGIAHAAELLEQWADEREEEATATAAATPAFFQVGRTYSREHHGEPVAFHVDAISTSPDGRQTVAHGWRTDPYSDWGPFDSDDFTGWTDVTEAGDR